MTEFEREEKLAFFENRYIDVDGGGIEYAMPLREYADVRAEYFGYDSYEELLNNGLDIPFNGAYKMYEKKDIKDILNNYIRENPRFWGNWNCHISDKINPQNYYSINIENTDNEEKICINTITDNAIVSHAERIFVYDKGYFVKENISKNFTETVNDIIANVDNMNVYSELPIQSNEKTLDEHYEKLKNIGFDLTPDIKFAGQLQRVFKDIVKDRLDSISKNSILGIQEGGSSLYRIAINDKPQDYFSVDITGYNSTHELLFDLRTVKDNKVTDYKEITTSIDINSLNDSLQEIGNHILGESMELLYNTEEMFDIKENMVVYSPHEKSFVNQKLTDHYNLLKSAGYDEFPDNILMYNSQYDENMFKDAGAINSMEANIFNNEIIEETTVETQEKDNQSILNYNSSHEDILQPLYESEMVMGVPEEKRVTHIGFLTPNERKVTTKNPMSESKLKDIFNRITSGFNPNIIKKIRNRYNKNKDTYIKEQNAEHNQKLKDLKEINSKDTLYDKDISEDIGAISSTEKKPDDSWKKSKEEYIAEQKQKLYEINKNIAGIALNYTADPIKIAELCEFASKFYKYSLRNTMLIKDQNSGATFVQAFDKWKKAGYSVKKGEKGLKVFVPVKVVSVKDENGNFVKLSEASKELKQMYKNNQVESKQNVYYNVGNVFDISQTNCPVEKYPEFYGMGYKDVNQDILCKALESYIKDKMNVDVEIKDLTSISRRGYYSNTESKIVLSDKLKSSERLSTLTHEIGHAVMQHSGNDEDVFRNEIEADSFCIMLNSHLGIDITDMRKVHLSNNFSMWESEMLDKDKEYQFDELLGNVQKKFSSIVETIDEYIDYEVAQDKTNDISENIEKEAAEMSDFTEKQLNSEYLTQPEISEIEIG